ncbi:SixA phosphatase family protein [Polyangium jinanense]|uniref:Histidine phosphatase family protein n=1 Tax=Polyangium jinanense TaxID=2829994 RepID=A0A9X4AY78_9BACT|nr:histidine phosphatase family protein [Polyangium jinanense]MDC3956847.1 histidine phosphatase family protein [Polyangium jinanense]MDC3957682.1 histidine phosphatase family protein [Polyangium jinanense]MDC3987110.1 histidine phosphatase family protein [Polyangium jinanense]
MNLYVMRHGLAAESSPSGRDRDRPLTSEGILGVEEIGKTLRAQHGPTLGRIVASTYLRAHHTAELMAGVLSAAAIPIETFSELEPDEPPPVALLRELATANADALLVGHHPMVIALLRLLVRDVAELPLGLHPGMLVGIARPSGPDVKPELGGSFRVTTVLRPAR